MATFVKDLVQLGLRNVWVGGLIGTYRQLLSQFVHYHIHTDDQND